IKDERLILKNLQNIRIAYLVQTIGIVAILVYDLVTKGMETMTKNPLWFVFILTGVVTAYLNMSISVEHETNEKSPKKKLVIWLAVSIIISLVMGVLTSMSDGNGLLTGGIVFLCFLAAGLYVYYLRGKGD